MRVHWTVFEDGDRHVEGQIFEPEQETSKVILFCPGFPGLGGPLFEQRHVATLTQEGYAVVVLRHCGTRLDSPTAALMVNNGARLRHARQNNQKYLGGAPSTAEYWLSEPLIALKTLTNVYDDIYIFGNSFGALSSLWSLSTPGAPLNKVRHLICVAGAQGVHSDVAETDIMRIWKPEFLSVDKVTDKVSLDAPENTAATLQHCYEELPDRTWLLPPSIKITYLVVANDELVNRGDTERFQAAIGGRGTIVMDEVDKAAYQYDLMAHYMPDYPTEEFLALLKE